jgi:hypothetical protein
MSKKQLLALAVAFAVLSTPLALAAPASAAPISTTSSPIFTDRDDKDKHEDHEDEDDEDEDDEDDEDGWGHEDNHSLPPVVIRPHGDDDDEDEEGDHEEGDDDDQDDEDEGGFVLPATPSAEPSVTPSASPFDSSSDKSSTNANYSVSPLSPLAVGSAPTTTSTSGAEQVVGANAINPDAAPAIDPASIRTSAKTPADVFMESATWGLMAMGAGALALGSVAGVKTLSARRKPEGEYFYDSEN